MGREVMMVPLDFDFPIGESYADHTYNAHVKACPAQSHDDCDHPYWRDVVPKGDGWQLWQTVSDGPVTPVFATAEQLIDYMSQPCDCGERWCEDPWPKLPRGKGWRRPVAEKFVREAGWIPSMIMQGGRVLSASETVDAIVDRKT
jgi:hypothetical protein